MKKIISILLSLALCLGMCPPVALAADVTNNAAGSTLDVLNQGDTMFNNYGTIKTNCGTVYNNDATGIIESNTGSVWANYGIVYNNSGNVGENLNSTGASGSGLTPGKVYNIDGGTVTGGYYNTGTDYYLIKLADGTSHVTLTAESSGLAGDEKQYITNGSTATLTAEDGYVIQSATAGDVSGTVQDGGKTYTFTFGTVSAVTSVSAVAVAAGNDAEPDGTAANPWPCGENLTAVLDGTTLTITGTGAMTDYAGNDRPWANSYITNVVLPDGLTTIGNNAFMSCRLTSVDIPEGVETIGSSAFQSSSLTSVTIPASVTQVGFSAFLYCNSLQTLTVQGKPNLSGLAFSTCSELHTINFLSKTPPSITKSQYNLETFANCSAVTAINVPHGCVDAYKTALADSGLSDLDTLITAPAEHDWNPDGSCACGAQAVAKVEKGGSDTVYVEASGLDAALANSGNAGATFTLLANVERTNTLTIKVNCTLDLGGHNITFTGTEYVWVQGSVTAMTIRGEGEIISEQSHALAVNGSVTLEGGTFTSNGENSAGVYVNSASASLSVTGEYVTIRNTGGGYGLAVNSAQSVQLSAGICEGEKAIEVFGSGNLASLLAEGCAYYRDGTPIALEADGQELTGTMTVKACSHTGEGVCTYTHNENTSTHTKTCLACGYTETGDCGFEKTADPTADSHTGQCPDCKRDRSGAHSFSDWAGNPVARTCTVCGYEQTAVARVEKDSTTTYVGALANAFTEGNSGATVTLLSEVDLGSNYIGIRGSSTFTLDLNGQTVKASHYGAFDISGGSLTIQDSGTGGKIESSNITIKVTGGTLSIKSGTVSGFYGVQITSGTVNISGGVISGTEKGLWVNGGGNIVLSGGAYSGRLAIWVDANVSVMLKDLLASECAYHSGDTPIPLQPDGKELTGPVTVQACDHTGAEATNNGDGTHRVNCPYCGYTSADEPHSFNETGLCPACKLQAAAKVEKDGSDTVYVEASGLASAFAAENTGATVTLLKDVDLGENDLMLLSGTFTLDCGAFTLSSSSEYFVIKLDNANLTFAGGTIQCNGTGNAVFCATGTFTMTGGTLNAASDYALNCAYGGEANIQGGTVGTQGKGLCIGNPDRVKLSGGTYATICIVSNYGTQKVPLSTILADGRAAYGPDGPITRDTVDAELTGPIIVKECEHDGVKPTSNSDGTHALKCPYCGYSEAAVDCTYVFSGTTGTCAACGDKVTVAVSGTEGLTYDGNEKKPGVTVTRAGTELATSNYTVAYTGNKNAGENKASVTVTIGDEQGSYTENFSIGKATPTVTWSSTAQELTYTGQPAAIEPTVTLVNGEKFEGTISYSYTGTSSGAGLPTNAGTYKIKASIAEQGNYTAAQSEEMTLTIKKADVTVTAPAAKTLTYTGSAQALVTAGTASVGDVVYSTAQDGTYTKNIPTGTNAGTYDVWYKVEGTDNYNGTAPAKVAVTINKANHENVTVETSAKFGTSRTYDISGLLPDGAELGNITVSVGIFADPQPAVSEGVLSYMLAADQTNVNKSGTVTVPVTSSTNYNAFNLIIRITVADVDIPELTVNAISVTYTGQPVPDARISGTAVSNGTPVKGGWSFVPGQALTDVADSGLKEVIFTPEDSTLYGKAKGYAQVQIGKATPTLRLTASPTATTGGDVTFSLSGLPDGGTANLTCSDKDITVTKNQDGTFTANIPQGGTDTTYTFTAAYAGDSNHEKANTSCSVQRKALTELPDPPSDDGSNKFKLVMEEGISEVPAGLKTNASLDTPEELEAVMKTKVTEQTPTIPAANTAVYDVALLVSADSGATWAPANSSNFPTGGLTVTLPYPSGTDSSYTFTVVHMFTTTDFGNVIGDIETPAVTNTANGLRFTVTGLSPISVGWEKKSSGSSGSGGGWVSYYTIKVNDSEHGKVTADRTSIYAGGTVTLTVQPDEGYKLDKITVTDSQNQAVELTEKNGKYTFKMPSRNVTVKADFVPAGSPSPEPTGSPSPEPSGSPTPTTSPSPSPKPWKNPFPDVSDTGWYIKAVEFVCKNGLMAGYENGRFGPNDSLTRAQFAQIIYSKAGRPKAGSGVFSDVTTGWYANAVNWAAAEGIVTGVGGGRFAPDRPITRQDLAVMLWRYAGSPEPRKNELDFSDAGKVSTYAWKALCWANENGIVSGKGNGILDPKGKATRAEAAQMLMNYSEK